MNQTIHKSTTPANSQIRKFFTKIDYEDAYAFEINSSSDNIVDIYIKIFNTAPKWVEYALRFRNLLVSPFGLKTEMKKNNIHNIKEGEKAGIFTIYKIYDNEIIAGENDKHLDFRVSLHGSIDAVSTITVSTIVHYNNSFGKFYMTLISPFHKIVVKSLLKNALQRINK